MRSPVAGLPGGEAADSEPPTQALPRSPMGVTVDRRQIGPGTLLGRYVVLRLLGKGGLGEVHTAYDPELDRKVAVKVLEGAVVGTRDAQELQQRLLREAQAMAKLAHPNVVSVYDVGTERDDVFIAMELIEGQTLRAWLRAEPRSWREIRDAMVQAGQGLLAAHRAGMLHRDFKPNNVIVGNDGRVRVLDFGLARLLGRHGSDPPHTGSDDARSTAWTPNDAVTDSRLLMGTFGYMAPEQYERGALDPRTDQFAFCVTLYEAMFNRRPFTGRTPEEIRAATLACDLPELHRSTGGSRVPSDASRQPVAMPSWMRRVLDRGLRRDPAERYPSMEALLADLQRDRSKRKRTWLVGIALLLCTGLGGAIAWSLRPEPPPDSRIETLANEARAAAAKINFVYPPPEDPQAPTAYRVVQELEAIEGDMEAVAQHTAQELRQEFSATLVRLGDRYWQEDGGRPFAIDYYAAALVFVPDDEHARERTAMTPGELVALRTKADALDFSPAELQAAETLVALAEQDDARRAEKIARLLEQHPERAATTAMNLERLLDAGPRRRSRTEPAPPPAPASPPIVAKAPAEPVEPAPTIDDRTHARTEPDANDPPRSSQGEARTAVREARAALQRGQLDAAEAAFHRALQNDRTQPDALLGLAELYFEKGAYQRALTFAERGVRAAPRSARHQLLYGDACFRVLRYNDARTAYEKAHKLGSKSAEGRLQRLAATVGK